MTASCGAAMLVSHIIGDGSEPESEGPDASLGTVSWQLRGTNEHPIFGSEVLVTDAVVAVSGRKLS